MIIASIIVVGWYTGLLPFLLGTTYGLIIVNLIYYVAIFFASFLVSYLMRRAFRPVFEKIEKTVRELLKK